MISSASQDGSTNLSQRPIFSTNATIALVALAVFVADMLTKHVVTTTFLPGESRIVVASLLRWTYERNVHGAFGLFGSNGVLLVVMALIVLVVFWWLFHEAAQRSLVVCVAFGMIVGGAIGNIVDRMQHGFVVDFVDFYRIWPDIFNLADSCITVGVIFLLLSGLATRRHA